MFKAMTVSPDKMLCALAQVAMGMGLMQAELWTISGTLDSPVSGQTWGLLGTHGRSLVKAKLGVNNTYNSRTFISA